MGEAAEKIENEEELEDLETGDPEEETGMSPEEGRTEEESDEEARALARYEETQALARSMGWVDKEDFRSDPTRWVDAETFVEKGMNDLPILRERLRAQSKRMNSLESDITDFKGYHERTLKSEYKRGWDDLQEKQLAAVEEGNTEEYQRIERQKSALADSHARETRPSDAQPENKLYTGWKERNSSWFGKDAAMTSYANRMSDFLAETRPELIGKAEFLDEIEKEVRTRYKDKFENTHRSDAQTVESGGTVRRQRGKGQTYADLPAEAKKSCDRYVRRGLLTKEQYIKDYEWD